MRKSFLSLVPLFVIVLIFFYPILKGMIPFPGDLLVGTPPYNSYSYLGYAPGGVPTKFQGLDVIRESFPWKYFAVSQLKKGQLPLWDPYNFSGNPLLANFQSGVFYPLNIVFFILPFTNSWTVYIFLGPFLACIFLYLFLRELRLSRLSSVFGGLVFAFSSYMVVWLEWGNIPHTFLWLPLALLFTEKFIKKSKWQYVAGLIASLLFSILAGYIQGFFYSLIIVIFYYAAKNLRQLTQDIGKTLIFFGSLLGAILLSSLQLLPTLSLLAISSRNNYSLSQITNLLNPWWYSITTLIPDFFGNPAVHNYWFSGTYIERVSYFGVIPLLLALSVLFLRKKEIVIFSVVFLVAWLFSIDFLWVKYIYLLPIPMLSTTVPTRILSVVCLSGAILSSYGLDLLLGGKNPRRFFIASIVGLIVLSLGWGFGLVFGKALGLSPDQLTITKHNLILPTVFLLVFFVSVFYRFTKVLKLLPFFLSYIGIGLLTITLLDLFYFFHKITPFSPGDFVYPQTPVVSYLQQHAGLNRFWGYGSAYISSNFQTVDHTFSPEGDDPLHSKIYSQFIELSKTGSIPAVPSRLDANIAPGYGPTDLKSNFFRERVLQIDGVRYILNKDDSLSKTFQSNTDTFPPDKYRLIWQQAPWQIYENLQAAPRVFLTDSYQLIPDKDTTAQALFSPTFDPRKSIILASDPKFSVGHLTRQQINVVAYQPNQVTLATQANANALLFLSDTYTPDWSVTIDGKRARVYRADYAFRAVPVAKGSHTVVFSYYPKSFDLGWKISLVSLLGLVGGLVSLKKKNVLL